MPYNCIQCVAFLSIKCLVVEQLSAHHQIS